MRLSQKELDTLTGMMIVLFHAGERCVQIIENEFVAQQRDTQEYKQLVSMVGKARAEAWLQETCKKVLRHDDKMRVRTIIKQADDLRANISRLTDMAVSIGNGEDVVDNFDALINDANIICRLMCYYSNATTDEMLVKMESTLRLLAKGKRVSDNIMELFEPKV